LSDLATVLTVPNPVHCLLLLLHAIILLSSAEVKIVS
jgi:hypothetical protein